MQQNFTFSVAFFTVAGMPIVFQLAKVRGDKEEE